MSQHTIVIKQDSFQPGSLRIQPGDSVVWDNQDPHDHTATGSSSRARFDTGVIKGGTQSKPIRFGSPTSYGGIEVICRCHGAMEGRLFVTAGSPPEALARNAALQAKAASIDPGITYSVETWRTIARIVAGHWVYDMADNFAYSMNLVYTGAILDQMNTEWSAVETFWQQQTGTGKAVLLRDPDSNSVSVDPTAFMDESRDKLEALGRRIRVARRTLRVAGVNPVQYPTPERPDDPDAVNPFGRLYGGQSDDPFGEAITVNYAGLRLTPDPAPEAQGALRTEVQLAEMRHEAYALGSLWSIETLQDMGAEVPDSLKQSYRTTRAALLIDDYHTLAAHLYFGLSKLFKSGEFQADQFVAGIRRMTVHGEWDGSWTPMWHWLRWIDGYITVKETGQLPDPVGLG